MSPDQDRNHPPAPGDLPHRGEDAPVREYHFPNITAPISPADLLSFGLEEPVSPRPSPAPSLKEARSFFADYLVVELLGGGAMGAVFKATKVDSGENVAIKILPDELVGNPEFEERFTREAGVMDRLSHPHIVRIFHFDRTEKGRFYFVMEFVDGVDLARHLDQGKVDTEQAVAWTGQIASALDEAHRMGFVHRDINPSNILLGKDGKVKVADFGLAKLVSATTESGGPVVDLTLTGFALGTPSYMSPEQIKGDGYVDRRSDIYSLGVVFHELVSGQRPIGPFAVSSKDLHRDPKIDKVLRNSLNPDPDRRYQRIADMKSDLDRIDVPKPE